MARKQTAAAPAPQPIPEVHILACQVRRTGLLDEDLDELVHDAVQEAGLEVLNTLDDEEAQDAFIGEREQEASAINNGGVEEQLAYLLRFDSADALGAKLWQIAKDKVRILDAKQAVLRARRLKTN